LDSLAITGKLYTACWTFKNLCLQGKAPYALYDMSRSTSTPTIFIRKILSLIGMGHYSIGKLSRQFPWLNID